MANCRKIRGSDARRNGALLLAAALGCALLAGCQQGDTETAETTRDPSPALTPSARMTAAPDGSALPPGDWSIEEDASGASARFGPPASEPLVSIVCDAGGNTVTLSMPGDADSTQTYIIKAGGTAARLDMEPSGGALPIMRASINPQQAVFAGFSDPGNLIEITRPGSDLLRMPGHPGVRRVFEACSR